jgi:hypothetical protein
MFSGKLCSLNQETLRLAERFDAGRSSAIFLHRVCASGLPFQLQLRFTCEYCSKRDRHGAEIAVTNGCDNIVRNKGELI